MSTKKVTIFEYLDYRLFLKDMCRFRKKESSHFSQRQLLRQAGFKSSNFLKLIVDGKRNLSPEGVWKLAKALKLSKPESTFFETLVLFSQAKTLEEKNRHYEKILQTKAYNNVKKLAASQYAYFSDWKFVAFRELVCLKGFQENPEWINRKLGTKLSSDEIVKMIEMLLTLNLLARTADGRLRQTDEKIVTSPEISTLAVLNFHKKMIQKASDALETSRTADRDISGLTISVSKLQYEKIKERLNQFRREIHGLASAEAQDSEAVFQINFQLFNLSEVPWN
ncbi:MAG: TIGR02147 family protein [Deltaproteobacteria bacterium]|nr:TIGR02147 family protein [Deltaproteobacteria bacterium]